LAAWIDGIKDELVSGMVVLARIKQLERDS
jgi:hypothetical protein